MSEKRPFYAFFPYLRTSGPVRIRGVELRGSAHLEGLSDVTKRAVELLSATFCLHDGSVIEDVVFTYGETSGDPVEEAKIEENLRRVQLLLAYAHTTPRHTSEPWLSAEHATIFLFREDHMVPRMLVKPGEEKLKTTPATDMSKWVEPGFSGMRNWTANVWVIEGCQIYPEFPHFYRNMWQNLTSTLSEYFSLPHTWAMLRLYQGDDRIDPVIADRIFLAMEWYVASCRFASDEEEKLLFLAIALEALLRVRDGEGLTERFKDAVITLIGPIPRLDSWLEQFHSERSKLVHEGRPHHRLAFFAADKKDLKDLQKGKVQAPTHGMLIDYGLRVFRLCMNSIVSAAVMAVEAGLANLFIPDSERLREVLKILNSKDMPATDRLVEAAKEIRHLGGVESARGVDPHMYAPLDQLWAVCRLTLEATRDAVTDLVPEAATALAEAIKHSTDMSVSQFERLERLNLLLRNDSTQRKVETANAITGLTWYLTYLLCPTVKLRVHSEEAKKRASG